MPSAGKGILGLGCLPAPRLVVTHLLLLALQRRLQHTDGIRDALSFKFVHNLVGLVVRCKGTHKDTPRQEKILSGKSLETYL